MQQLFHLLIFLIQPYIFRPTNSPILMNTFLTVYTDFGTIRRHCCRPEMESKFHLNRGTGRQQCRCIVPKLYTQSKKVFMRMGEFVGRNM